MEILDLVLRRLSATEETEEIALAISIVGDFIKEYCCLTEIHPSLFQLWADMVYSLLTEAKVGEDQSLTGLSSISMGDVAYAFSTEKLSGRDIFESLLHDYGHRLNKERKGLFR